MNTSLTMPLLRDHDAAPTAVSAAVQPQRRLVMAFAAIWLVGFLVRLVMAHKFAAPIVLDLAWNDATGWNLAQGNGFTASPQPPYEPALFRTPGYPLFLALIYSLFGHNVYAVFSVQAALDALTAVLTGLIALQYFAPRVAVLGAALYALYPYTAIFCGQLHQDILLTFSVVLFLWLLSQAFHRKQWQWWAVAGLVLGWVVVVKPIFVLFFPVPMLAALLSQPQWSRRIGMIFITGIAMCLVVAPLLIRNYRVFGRFPLMSIGGTGTIMRNLVQEIDMGEATMVEKQWAGEINTDPSRKKAVQEFTKKWSSLTVYDEERNRAYLSQMPDGHKLIEVEKAAAEQWGPELRKRTGGYFRVMLSHIPRLWLTQRAVSQTGKVALLGQLLSWLVLGGGLVGMLLLRNHWKRLIILYSAIIIGTLMYIPYTVESRYTMPVRPIMILFIAAGLFFIWNALNARRRVAAS